MITLEDVRQYLRIHEPDHVALIDAIEGLAEISGPYREKVHIWLNEDGGTVYFRDYIASEVRYWPKVLKIGEEFAPSTKWHNTWLPVHEAAEVLRLRKHYSMPDPDNLEELRALPHFGMF